MTLSFVVAGLVLGTLYALMALGISLIFRTTGVLNFAHAPTGMIAAYVVFSFREWGVPYWVGVVPAILVSVVLSVFVGLVVVRPVLHLPTNALLASVGVMTALLAVPSVIWNESAKPGSGFPHGGVEVASLRISWHEVGAIVITVLLMAVVYVLLERAPLGKRIRAVADDRQSAAVLGVSLVAVDIAVWALAGLLAAIAAILIAPLTVVNAAGMYLFSLKALAAALIGGLSSLPGALVGGLVLGVLEGLVLLQNFRLPGMTDLVTFAVIMVVLLLRSDVIQQSLVARLGAR